MRVYTIMCGENMEIKECLILEGQGIVVQIIDVEEFSSKRALLREAIRVLQEEMDKYA